MNTAEAIFKSLDEQVSRYIDGGAIMRDLYITMNQADYDTLRKHAETIWKRKTAPRMYCGLKIEVSGNDLDKPTVCYKSQYKIVGKVHIFDITSAPPNMTKRQMEKWLKENPQCEKVIEPKDFITPITHPNGTPFDASKIDTKPIETTPQVVHNGDFSEFKADSWGNETQTIPPIETELYINNEPIGKHLAEVNRLLTEAIALSQVSGDNTKAQMRDKIIEARRITEEIKRGK